jgi:acetate kinase
MSPGAQVLVVNTGSSSLKYQVVDPGTGASSARGLVERIGESEPRLIHVAEGGQPVEHGADLPDHAAALALMLETLRSPDGALPPLLAVGHRVVHGGPTYREPVIVDDDVEDAIAGLIPLAPLHNPAGLLGIRELRRLLPDVPHVAVFDTAFHATMPPEAYTYAVPADLARHLHLRKYGFHGTSYRYVTRRSAEFLGLPVEQVNLIVCHLGNGASMAAIRHGASVDTSMGMTPLQGLPMGTRSGDLDPAVIWHLVRTAGFTLDDTDTLLNKQSGLKGMAGTQDMREVRALADAGDVDARLALDVYAYRVRGYIGSYLAAVPDVHAIVFTAGIGEHDADLRREVCQPLRHLGIHLDEQRNHASASGTRSIDDGTGTIRLLVAPTDEEAEIARQAAEAVEGSGA